MQAKTNYSKKQERQSFIRAELKILKKFWKIAKDIKKGLQIMTMTY